MYFLSKEASLRYLLGDLPEVVDEANGGSLLQWVVDVVDVHLALIEEVVEDIDSLHGGWPLLLVAEYEVYPLMQVGADVVTLESLGIAEGHQRLCARWIAASHYNGKDTLAAFLQASWNSIPSCSPTTHKYRAGSTTEASGSRALLKVPTVI